MDACWNKIDAVENKINAYCRNKRYRSYGAHAFRHTVGYPNEKAPKRTHPHRYQHSPQQGKIKADDIHKSTVEIAVIPKRNVRPLYENKTDGKFGKRRKQSHGDKIQWKP